MKLFVPFLFAIIIANASSAQEKWGSIDVTIAGARFVVVETCGDTMIDGLIYEKLYYSDETFSQYYGGHRVSGDSVLIKYVNSSDENLLYNFGLELGETFNGDWGTFEVVNIDFEYVFGIERKRMTLRNSAYGYEDVWVEGVGSIKSGYLFAGIPDDIFDAGSTFTCYYSNQYSDWYYAQAAPSDCLANEVTSPCLSLSTKDIASGFSFKIVPNPASDFVEIQSSMRLNYEMFCNIYDLNGKRIFSKNLYKGQSRIPLSTLQNGVYIIEINTEGVKEIQKIVVAH